MIIVELANGTRTRSGQVDSGKRFSSTTWYWKISDNSSTWKRMVYTNWADGEPNFVAQNESCLMIFYWVDFWNDFACDATQSSDSDFLGCSICEIEP